MKKEHFMNEVKLCKKGHDILKCNTVIKFKEQFGECEMMCDTTVEPCKVVINTENKKIDTYRNGGGHMNSI
jgi:hypothetical protein